MTADGELYIDGDCTDTFTPELDKVFGKGKWKIDDSPYSDLWDMRTFPLQADILIQDIDTNEIIGKAVIISKPIIVEDMGGRYVDLEPESINITKM